jgi:uncharacterized membrane protein YozB (DUF420 family)
MIAEGFLGTRADLIIDLVMTVSGFLPAIMMFTFYLAARGKRKLHKNIQLGLLLLVTFLVVALEVDVRSGDLQAAGALSAYHDSMILSVVFIIHLLFATTTFVGWIWLVVKSAKLYPKGFKSFNHKKWGKILFVDVVLTVITGWILYIMVFAL